MVSPEPRAGLNAAATAIAGGRSGKWLRAISQLGLVSRAVVYLLVGGLAWRLAVEGHGKDAESASSNGAVAEVAHHSWGLAALLVMAAGFAGYAITQLVEFIFRPRPDTHAIHRWRQRFVSALGCLLYVIFCVTTLELLATSRRSAGTASSEQRANAAVAATLLRNGFGRILLLVIGLLLVVAGAELGRRSLQLTFQERFSARLHPSWLGHVVRGFGAFGCVARAAIFMLVGFFILRGAVLDKPDQVKGLDATFRSVAQSAFGPATLAVLASGLLCYGAYCLVEARYRDLTPGN